MESPNTIAHYRLRLTTVFVLMGTSLLSLAAARPPTDPLEFSLTPIGTYFNGAPFDKPAAKVVTHDPATQRLFVANERDNRVDVLSIADPANPIRTGWLDLSGYGGVVNGVNCCERLVAVAVQAPAKTDPGWAVFYDTDGRYLGDVQVGSLPDFIAFSPDGRWVLVANEGEPNANYTVDPEGSITIIDLSTGVRTPTVSTATFTAFNDAELDPSIRIYGPSATVAEDLEPESITVSADSTTAYVTLQENNALAIVDIPSATVTQLVGLGFKDHRLPGNGLDASDQDNKINIANWPVWGIYMPDEVAAYQYQGQTYLVMANEGDTRDYSACSEEVRVSKLTLDPEVFPDAATLKRPENLGRLNVSKVGSDPDHDGKVELLFVPGGRSFSIRNTAGKLVFDSSDQFEQVTAALYPWNFNCNNTSNTRDDRSDNKGPEPEGVVLGKVAGRMLAFIGCERIGGIFVYNVSDPFNPGLMNYVNTRTFANPFSYETAGDLGPEGLKFISADDSPSGKPLLVVANETSGSVTIFEIVKYSRHHSF
jgi:DNA-binding beta-propeller fold protein YncE